MKQILIIGDQCIDKFVYGEAKRLSPEAPVPVFTPHNTATSNGMAANVARNLRAMAPEYMITTQHNPETLTKTRYIDHKTNHMFLRVDEGDTVKPLELDLKLRASIPEFDAVVVSDYNKGYLPLSVIEYIGKNAKMSFIDSKKKLPLEVASLYTIVKMNEQEYESYNGSLDSISNSLIITLGSKGAKYKHKVFNSLQPKETIDVSGAGDTFLAAFVYWYLQTGSIQSAIVHANEKAAIVVTKKGVAVP